MSVADRSLVAVLAAALVGWSSVTALGQLPPGPSRPGPGGPGQQKQPWELDLELRVGRNGEVFGPAMLFCKAGGVPSAVRDRDGRIHVAFQWFADRSSPHWDRVARKTSDDGGRTWSEPEPLVFEGLPGNYQRPFNPTLVALPDGRMRIFFSSGPRPEPPGPMQPATYSAISDDGLHVRCEPGVRFTLPPQRVIDPAVLLVGETWPLTAPIGRPEDGAYHATSTDGLTFERQADIPSVDGANWTGNLLQRPTGLRFYGGSRRGLWYADSAAGQDWSTPRSLGFQGGDPTVVEVEPERFLLICVGAPPRNPRPGQP